MERQPSSTIHSHYAACAHTASKTHAGFYFTRLLQTKVPKQSAVETIKYTVFFVFTLLLLLIFMPLAWAGGEDLEGEERAEHLLSQHSQTELSIDTYLLTMSRNDGVCQHLRTLFQMDSTKKGRVTLNDHEEFNWLEWNKSFSIIYPYKNTVKIDPNEPLLENIIWRHEERYSSYIKAIQYTALFDINNDSKNEVVAFEHSDIQGAHFPDTRNGWDQLMVVNGEKIDELNNIEATTFFAPENKFILLPTIQKNYDLKEYPPIATVNGEKYWSSMDAPYIRPFKLNQQFYLALFGNVNTSVGDTRISRAQSLNDKNGIAIIKINKANDIEDICYFAKTSFEYGDK